MILVRDSFRIALPALLAAFLLAGCGDGGSSSDGGESPADGDTPAADDGGSPADVTNESVPGAGPTAPEPASFEFDPVKGDIDWQAFFPPGDGWKEHEQVFVFNNSAEPETLDPHLMTGVPEHTLALALFEGLVAHHPTTLQPIPGVAERWELSEDGTVLTFHLRKDAKWTNGDPITAEDFRWSWERALTPATASEYGYQFFAVKNAREFHEGTLKDFGKVGAKAIDDHTFEVTLGAPTPYFLDLCCFETLMPVHRATVEKHGSAWTRPENFVGNGPFTVAEWKPRDEIVMVPNEHYWNRSIVRLTKIRAKALDDANTSFNEYLAGSLDWIKAIPQKRIDEVQMHPDYYVWPYLGTYFFRFNVTEAPFDDVRVRKAFNLSVNKASLCKDILKAGQIPATGYVPPSIHGYESVNGPDYDPVEAKRLLAEAGFPAGEGFPAVTLTYNTSESHKQVCEVLSSMWRENLGVNVKLRNMEWKVYLEEVRKLRYQIARAGWIGDYTDPNTFMDMFVKDGGNNNTGWANADYDQAIRAAAVEQDPAKRMALFQKAEKLLIVDEFPILPIYYYVNQGLLRTRVRGLDENVRDLHPFQFIYVDGPPAKGK